jgi:hypothetical protein
MKGLEEIRRRAEELEANVHSADLKTTDPAGNPAWLQGREAIMIMREMLRISRDKGHDNLRMIDIPEDLQHRILLWSKVQLSDNSGELSIIIKKQCEGIACR